MLLDAEQARLLSDPNRSDIIQLLAERPASIKQLAESMDRPKGSVGHHVHALEGAGIIAVVATRQVRAMTEKFYGRLAQTYVIPPFEEAGHSPLLVEAMAEIREPREGEAGVFTIRHARIPDDQAEAFADELVHLAESFAARPRGGSTTYGFLVGVYPTDRPSLKEDE
jgi:DNA-binding transcriptional ArsR family regulator